MIARAMRYARASATVRTRLGGLLRPGEYEILLNAAEVPEFLEALRTTPYASALRTAGKSFAFALQHQWIGRTESVANLQPAPARDLCSAYLAKIEIEAVKALLRGIGGRVERRRLLSMLPPLPAGSSLPLTALSATKNIEEAARVLKGTVYGSAIEQGVKEARASGDHLLWSIEAALDREFFLTLHGACRRFSGAERAVVNRQIGAVADVFNVLAAERLNKTFHLTPQAVSRQLVPFGLRLGVEERRALCEWPGEGPPPIRLPGSLAGGPLRIALMRMLCREAAKPLFTVPFHAGLVFAYVLLSELEVDDLLAIHEGKQWHVERSIIAAGLIRFSGPALNGGGSGV
jgi:V/A-type H+-transporting ATPase subunit C